MAGLWRRDAAGLRDADHARREPGRATSWRKPLKPPRSGGSDKDDHMFRIWNSTPRRPTLLRWLVTGLVALLAACGGSDDDAAGGGSPPPVATAALTGVAAVGAPIPNAVVTGTNVRGETATATTGADGSFTLNVNEGAPYALQVTDADGNTWYSYAQAAGRANLTPLTTLALSQAAGNRPLADLLAAWASSAPTAEQVLAAAATVNANLAELMRAAGVDPAATNVFTQTFSANQQGLDAVLDAMRLSFSCSANVCTQSISSPTGEVLLTWNGNISTLGFSVSWSGGATGGGQVDVSLGACAPNATPGTYSMVVQTTVSGPAGVPVPEICVNGLPGKPSSESDFCGSGDVTGALPPQVAITECSYADPVGTISARITSPIVIDYTVTYTFVLR
jgi:hypothetical protein